MKDARYILIAFGFLAVIAACKKSNSSASAQTISLLQNKWQLVSQTTLDPPEGNSPADTSTYVGQPGDYFLFASDYKTFFYAGSYTSILGLGVDSGSYSIPNNNTIVLSYPPAKESVNITIRALTANQLVFSFLASVSSTGSPTYYRTYIDSLER
jgi:hypothetical protein